jgi:hypothetical protein
MLLTPGLISTHAHLAGSPLDKSFIEDRGRRQFYNSGLFERSGPSAPGSRRPHVVTDGQR